MKLLTNIDSSFGQFILFSSLFAKFVPTNYDLAVGWEDSCSISSLVLLCHFEYHVKLTDVFCIGPPEIYGTENSVNDTEKVSVEEEGMQLECEAQGSPTPSKNSTYFVMVLRCAKLFPAKPF